MKTTIFDLPCSFVIENRLYLPFLCSKMTRTVTNEFYDDSRGGGSSSHRGGDRDRDGYGSRLISPNLCVPNSCAQNCQFFLKISEFPLARKSLNDNRILISHSYLYRKFDVSSVFETLCGSSHTSVARFLRRKV